ncbi:MAG: folylpolyglutamate synthase/dihydrofolate synthase family protein [Chloroflexota bacterium]
MNYREAEEYVLSFTNYEKTPGVPYTLANYDLRRMDELLVPLGNPHLAAKTVHIAGTKGKGSTAAMIHSILKTAGYRAALYTSPHLISLRERFKINDDLISESDFAALVTEIRPLVDEVTRRSAYGPLTTFEILTVAAFLYFQRQKADYQVLEVGLGGRLDATNVVPAPEVCVITSISLDHMAALGDTVAKIAREKAGIIKPGVVTVTAWLPDGAWQVVSDIAREKGSPRNVVREHHSWEELSSGLDGQELLVKGRLGQYRVHVPLIGSYQQENAVVAVAAVEALIEQGARITSEHIVHGLADVRWPGRFQILRRNPFLVLDGAHNRDSIEKFMSALGGLFGLIVPCICMPGYEFNPRVNTKKVYIICGMSVDKDIPGIIDGLIDCFFCTAAPADFFHFILTRADHPRAADPVMVREEFIKRYWKDRVQVVDKVDAAISQALAAAAPDGLVAVTGSLFVVGEALAWAEKHPEALK